MKKKSQSEILLSRNVHFNQIYILCCFYIYILYFKLLLFLFTYFSDMTCLECDIHLSYCLLILGGKSLLPEHSKNLLYCKNGCLSWGHITKRMVHGWSQSWVKPFTTNCCPILTSAMILRWLWYSYSLHFYHFTKHDTSFP